MKILTLGPKRKVSETPDNRADLSFLLTGAYCDITMNKIETTILTPGGDVLVCRGRDSNFMERLLPKADLSETSRAATVPETDPLCGGLANTVSDACVGVPFGNSSPRAVHMAMEPAASDSDVIDSSSPSKENDYDSLMSPPSFDYSQYEAPSTEKARTPLAEVPENNGDSLTKIFGSLLNPRVAEEANVSRAAEEKGNDNMTPDSLAPPMVMHGVPTCLPGLPEIRISSISAHPLGSHVLLISSEGMLFSYGLNNRGQLGLGTPETFVKAPTLVTAVLEAGGKTTCCSAGVDHSIIVVKTDDQRVGRLRNTKASSEHSFQRVISSPSRISNARSTDPDEVSPNASPDDLVMFHHQVYAFGANDHKKLGLMNPSSASNVSLPHRVALHAKVWPGEEMAKSLPPPGIFQVSASVHHSAALVRRATDTIEIYTWGQSTALGFASEDPCVGIPAKIDTLSQATSDSMLKDSEYPKQIALGVTSSFVTTNAGRCFAFGSSDCGLLGLGKTSSPTPASLSFPSKNGSVAGISSISIGAKHAIATAQSGEVYAWGQDPATSETLTRPELLHAVTPAVKTCAGFDSSAFISNVGLVKTYGQKSGRLGQGEVPPNPKLPAPLFGGLRLWREGEY